MIISKNIRLNGKHQKPVLVDIYFQSTDAAKPVIIFCHGYKGFKDWGAWDLMAMAFANAGFYFLKFNFSHNGGTIEQPIDFPDLESFGNNNYIKELDDLESVIDWVFDNPEIKKEANLNQISLIGHSRGGGIVLIKAAEDKRIKKVVSLAGVSNFKTRFPQGEAFNSWKDNGVYFVENGRTKQQMPHYFQFYENFAENEERLSIQRAVSNLKIPYLIIHGNNDSTVSIKEAESLHKWHPKSEFITIDGANHVFGASHPWGNNNLPKDLESIVHKSSAFLNYSILKRF